MYHNYFQYNVNFSLGFWYSFTINLGKVISRVIFLQVRKRLSADGRREQFLVNTEGFFVNSES